MRLLIIGVHTFNLVYLMLLLLGISNVTRSQSVITSDQVVKEGDNEVVIPCDYSQVTDRLIPTAIIWNEADEAGAIIATGIVHDVKIVNGRYSLRKTSANAELVIAKPVRNDNMRRFLCKIRTQSGDWIVSDHPSILTVYYLDEPVLIASTSSVYEGNSVNLTCSIPDGDPVPSITWYKDGKAISCTTDTTGFTTGGDALEIIIEAATTTDNGRYMCKAESDQYKGEDGKTSNQIDLKVIRTDLKITFESEAGTATCTAKGRPKPSFVMIYNDGKMIEKEEFTASVKIDEEFCKTNITCYAENGEVNTTEPLKTCNTVPSSCIALTIGIFFVGIFVGCFGLFAGSIGYSRIKQKKSEAVRSTSTRKKDTYAPYIVDTGDESHAYQDLQYPNAVYVNSRAGKYNK